MSSFETPIKKHLDCFQPCHCDCCQPCVCDPCRPEPKFHQRDSKVVMSCGTGTGATLPTFSGIPVGTTNNGNSYYPLSTCLVLGTVSLDSRGLFKPTVKVDFSSLISFRIATINYDVFNYFFRLTFRLSRACEHGPQIPLGTWNYEQSSNLATNIPLPPETIVQQTAPVTDSFSFTWCECQDCPGCCTYIVELIDVQTCNIECASITNVGINAIAVSC